ncbi:MAG: T9SS type A sorting domain-containing protein, partial [bacterium]
GIGVAATEGYAYISDAARGFIAIDIRDPQKPVAVDSLAGSALGGGIAIAGKIAYWADGENGLRVIDISNPLDLRERTRFQQDSLFAVRAALKDSLIYLASGSLDGGGNVVNGVHILRNDFATGVREPSAPAPTVFELKQNHPNPFNPQTTINYRLNQSSAVRLEIFNLLGQKIKTLVDGAQPSGDYRAPWDGRDHRGETVTSGVYLYRLTIDGVTQTRRMLFLR